MVTSDDIRLTRHTVRAAPAVWRSVAELYALVFAAPPYDEDPAELARIEHWGPDYLAAPGALLITAAGTEPAAMALARPLAADEDWRRLLARTGSVETAAMLARADDVLVVQELAVRPHAQRRGLGARCLRHAIAGRPESTIVLGVHEDAAAARAFYSGLGFTDAGGVDIAGGTRWLRILATARTSLERQPADPR